MDTEPKPKTPPSYSGGEMDENYQRQYVALRNLIQREADVHAVLELASQADGRWIYLIQTPFVTFPKFVIGLTDVENEEVEIFMRFGSEWSARAEWDRLDCGMEVHP